MAKFNLYKILVNHGNGYFHVPLQSKLQNCTYSNCDFHEKADPFLHFFVFLASFKLDSVSTRTNKKDDTSVKTHLHSNRTNVQKVSISSKTYYRSVFNLSKT